MFNDENFLIYGSTLDCTLGRKRRKKETNKHRQFTTVSTYTSTGRREEGREGRKEGGREGGRDDCTALIQQPQLTFDPIGC